MKRSISAGLVTFAAAIAVMPMAPVSAIEYQQNATGSCQGNLPASDTNIRKRPTAVRNEGDGNAFVNCSAMNAVANPVTAAGVRVHNAGVAPATINCTMVTGSQATRPSFPNQ